MSGETLVIQINWAYFLGIIGSLIVFAWYSESRFKGIETNIEWLKDRIKELSSDDKVARDNRRIQAIGNASPLRLLEPGKKVLVESGIQRYIDQNKEKLLKKCEHKSSTNAYEVQQCVFDLFDDLNFEKDTDQKLKTYAYEQGINMETIRRIGAIYFRDICLVAYDMNPEDIDKNNTK